MAGRVIALRIAVRVGDGRDVADFFAVVDTLGAGEGVGPAQRVEIDARAGRAVPRVGVGGGDEVTLVLRVADLFAAMHPEAIGEHVAARVKIDIGRGGTGPEQRVRAAESVTPAALLGVIGAERLRVVITGRVEVGDGERVTREQHGVVIAAGLQGGAALAAAGIAVEPAGGTAGGGEVVGVIRLGQAGRLQCEDARGGGESPPGSSFHG